MIRIGLLLLLLAATVVAEEKTRKILSAVYRIPPGFLNTPDPANAGGPPLAREGVKRLEGKDVPTVPGGVYDVREFLEALGLTFPAGSEALFFAGQDALLLRNTQENIDLLNSMGAGNGAEDFPNLRTEITTVELALPAGERSKSGNEYTALRAAAGDSWKEIGTLRVISKSGMTVSASTVFGDSSSPQNSAQPFQAPDLPAGAFGSTAAIENVLGPDGALIDSKVAFLFRGTRNEVPFDLRFDGSTLLRDGYPQILQLSEIPADSGKSPENRILLHAVILRVGVTRISALPFEDRKPKTP